MRSDRILRIPHRPPPPFPQSNLHQTEWPRTENNTIVNPFNAETLLHKIGRLKCFFQFEIIINVLDSTFRFT